MSGALPTRLEVLARIIGCELSYIARQLDREGIRNPSLRSMRELAAIALGDQLARARAVTRALRMRSPTSKYWVAGYPRLLAEWHPTKNGELFPDEVSYGSKRSIWWQCPEGPDHLWRVAPVERTTRNRGCPFCANRKVSVTNSLATLAPELAREWHPMLNSPLTPDLAIAKSHGHAWWCCTRNPEHVWRTRLANRWWSRSGCPFCSGLRASTANALATQVPALAQQWDRARNGELTPRDVAARSHLKVWWRCTRDPAHRWKARIDDRVIHDARCPVCTGKVPVPRRARKGRLNALADKHPTLAREWDRARNGATTPRDVTFGSHFRAWWKCSVHRTHRWRAAVGERSRGSGCPFCAGKRRLSQDAVPV